jgi:triosephosphate isomerase (TIM)
MQKIIVANMKMNLLTLAERERYLESLKNEFKKRKISGSEVVICPPSLHVENFVKKIKSGCMCVGVQNIFWEERGAFTGEISASMAKSVGAKYVILGHSDRRKYFGETEEIINQKLELALKNGLIPIVCVGENAGEKKNGKGEEAVLRQMRTCFKNMTPAKMEKVVVCYEPVWAISSNNPDHPPTTNEIMSAKLLIKKFLADNFGVKTAEKIRIIYGGSVFTTNVQETCIASVMDGALVGKESLIPSSFAKITEAIDNN